MYGSNATDVLKQFDRITYVIDSDTGVDGYGYSNDSSSGGYNQRNGTRNGGTTFSEYNTLIPLVRVVFVLLLRAGALLIQLGCFPTENIHNVIIQNLADISASLVSFTLIGYTIAFGHDVCGFVGFNAWIGSDDVAYDDAIFGLCCALVGTSVITMQLSGRLHLVACLTISTIYSGFFLPLLLHWTWPETGWMNSLLFLGVRVDFVDHACGFVTHATSGLIAFIGVVFLGRRLLLLNEIDEASLGTESPGTTCTGYFLFVIGLMGMSLPKKLYLHDTIGLIVLNDVVALSTGIFTSILLQVICCRKQFNYWGILRCLQSSICAMVIISSGNPYYTPFCVIVISIFGTVIFNFVSRCMQISAIEDYCNITALHLSSGIFSVFFPQIVKNFKLSIFFSHFTWQIISAVTILSTVSIAFISIFAILFCFSILRNRTDAISHGRSLKFARHTDNGGLVRRFFNLYEDAAIYEPGFSPVRKVKKLIAPQYQGDFYEKCERCRSHEIAHVSEEKLEKREDAVEENVEEFENEHASGDHKIYKLQELIESSVDLSKESNERRRMDAGEGETVMT